MPRVLLLVSARVLLVGAACLAFADCSSLSGIGPSAGDVVEEAGPGAAPRYELVDIDSNVVETLRQRGPNSFLAHFGDYRPSVEPRIGIGDTVTVTIWEAGAGGLFSAPVCCRRPFQYRLEKRDDPRSGRWTGRRDHCSLCRPNPCRRAHDQRRADYRRTCAARQSHPTASLGQCSVHSVSNTVTVTGEVVNGARVSLSIKGDRVMEVIAAAGGIRAPVNETYVQLSRGDVTERVRDDPSELRPKRKYLHARERRFDFDPGSRKRSSPTARWAASPKSLSMPKASTCRRLWPQAGGLLDAQSDPAGVFVFRYEPEDVARALSAG